MYKNERVDEIKSRIIYLEYELKDLNKELENI